MVLVVGDFGQVSANNHLQPDEPDKDSKSSHQYKPGQEREPTATNLAIAV